MGRSWRRWLVLLSVLHAVLLLSCTKDKKPTVPVDPSPLPISPAEVLVDLRQAYVDRDSTGYARLFSQDFVFTFNRADVINPDNPTPTSWGLSGELGATGHMFDDPQVTRIELGFIQSQAKPDSADSTGMVEIEMTNVIVAVDTRKADGSPLRLQVTSGSERFHLRNYPEELGRDGKPVWRIISWEDRGVGSGRGWMMQNISWGQIKSLYAR